MVIMPGIPIGGIATEQLVPVEMSGPVYLGGELDFAMCFSSGGEEEAASLVVLVGIGSGVEAIRSITFVVVSGLELESASSLLSSDCQKRFNCLKSVLSIYSGRGIPCGKALSEMSGRVIDGSFQFP